jgi:peptide chain release factor 1
VQAATSEVVPPALLTRARAVALEHSQLTDKLAVGFDTRSAKKLGEYSPIVNALGDWDKANEVSRQMED